MITASDDSYADGYYLLYATKSSYKSVTTLLRIAVVQGVGDLQSS